MKTPKEWADALVADFPHGPVYYGDLGEARALAEDAFRAAIAEEQKACALVAEQALGLDFPGAARKIAETIRARSKGGEG